MTSVMKRRTFLGTLGLGLLAPLAAGPQQAGKVYRIGLILTAAPSESGHLVKALGEGLRERECLETWVLQAEAGRVTVEALETIV